ncbi:hypothetical protein [Rhodococcus rhodochrous]|uniref:Uncharacterized protein n=1 Tax=Rhodococcus rhodochrous KG-21 TaxID=1441923 RepID=A0A0M8PJK6_RHORH|nr:hypothetical protein [Rhodococcus rhodochrous]KOS57616.1 hypothetical protein Z051_03490 [Rhodococcus rhodochrous KG-21]
MTGIVGVDRSGRRWAVVAVGDTVRARLVSDTGTPATMAIEELVYAHGPLVLSPAAGIERGGVCAAFVDTVDLVASDPETASVEQIRAVSAFARRILPTD